MYLLDTNVLSVAAPDESPARRNPVPGSGSESTRTKLYLSVITLLELNYGLAWLKHRGAMARAARLQLWINAVCGHLRGTRACLWTRLPALARGVELVVQRREQPECSGLGSEDAIIAATADLRRPCGF